MQRAPVFSIRTILLISLVSTALIFVATLFAGWFQLQQMREAQLWVSHSYKVVHAIERLICLVKDEETDQIVLSLSGDGSLAKADDFRIKEQFASVKKLSDLGAKQADEIETLEKKIKSQILFFHAKTQRSERLDSSTLGPALAQRSRHDMDIINQELIALQDDEVKVLDKRLEASRLSSERLQETLIIISVVALLLFVTLIFAIARYLSEQEKAAITDELTGLHNRRGFNLFVTQIIKTARRNNLELGLCFIDMDGLKAINDRYGHDLGSQALRSLAKSIRSAFRDEDIIARWGGDEFIVAGAFKQAPSESKLRERLDQELTKKKAAANYPFELNASIGVKTIQSTDLTFASLTQAIEEADQNMYKAKKLSKEMAMPELPPALKEEK